MGKRERVRGGETQETFEITRLKKTDKNTNGLSSTKEKWKNITLLSFFSGKILLESTQAKGEYTLDPTPHRRKNILVTIKIQNV
jgi:hypothetical protein